MDTTKTVRRRARFERHQPTTTDVDPQRILPATTAHHAAPQVTVNSQDQVASTDIFIAVMGMTGAGKSTFISHCTEEEVVIGHGMQSCTQEVRLFKCTDFAPINVCLLDTPGFDDTDRSDTDVLKEIACWLTSSYQNRIKLSGILYLHRISDNRMGRTALRNVRLFQKICGPDAFKNVLLVTTMWENLGWRDGNSREAELANNQIFWGAMIKEGARLCQHRQNTKASVLIILKQLVDRYVEKPRQEVPLAIQTEMVNKGKELSQTNAGKELDGTFRKEREKLLQEIKSAKLEMATAIEEHDKEMIDFYREEQEKSNEKLQRIQKDSEDLKVSMEKMHQEKIQKLQEEMQVQQELQKATEEQWQKKWKQMAELKDTLESEKGEAQKRQEACDVDIAVQNKLNEANERRIKNLQRRIEGLKIAQRLHNHHDQSDNSTHSDHWYCNECSRDFVDQHALSQHNDALHSGYGDSDSDSDSDSGSDDEQTYCYRCSRGFVDNHAFSQHDEAKHSDGSWDCDECERSFVDHRAFSQHMAAKH